MARVGIDLTSLPRLKGGVAVYLLELIAGLQRVDSFNEYRLILRQEHDALFAGLSDNFVTETVWLPSRPARLAWEQIALPDVCRRLRLDVLHSPHYTRPLRRLSCASVVGVMDLTMLAMPEHHTVTKRMFFRAMLPASIRRADRLIAISESTKRDLRSLLNIDPERVDVTPLAVSPAFSPDVPPSSVQALRQRYELPDTYLLYVGRLEPRKNLPRLLDAYEQVVRRVPGTPPLVLAGAVGWHRRDLQAALNGLGSHVRTLGFVPEEHLPALYAGALFFIYPSLYEGFGIPVLEALATGVPTITSNNSSMAEVAGAAAELIDPSSTSSLASAVERLLKDPARRTHLRRQGLERAAAFSWDRTAALSRNSYLRAAGDAARGR